jgi:hypothetical protein
MGIGPLGYEIAPQMKFFQRQLKSSDFKRADFLFTTIFKFFYTIKSELSKVLN